MPAYRVDFEVKSDLVIEPGQPEIAIAACGYTLIFRNGKVTESGDPTVLFASMIGQSDSLRTALDDFRPLLADRLDWFSFITQQRFEIVGPVMALAWEPGPGKREFIAVATQDPRWPPAPHFNQSMAASVQRFLQVEIPAFVIAGVRSFRVGVRERSPEEQFQKFWQALEVVIEGSKERLKEHVSCQKCRASLSCGQCGAIQEKTPMAGKAIRNRIIECMGEDEGVKVFAALSYLRNRLMHGGALAEAERVLREKHNMSLVDCVEFAARHAHGAILDAARPLLKDDAPIQLWGAERFVQSVLRARAHGELDHSGPAEHPDLPALNLQLESSFFPPVRPGGEWKSAVPE